MTGEKVLTTHLMAVHEELHPGANLDPDDVIKWITAILEAIRNCRNGATARSHIQRGSAIAVMAARNALIREGYRGNALAFARRLAERGALLTEIQLDALIDESADVPAPPPVAGGGWPAWCLVPLMLVAGLCASAEAAGWPVVGTGGGWPVSVEADLPDAGAGAAVPAVVAPEVRPEIELPWVQPWVYSGDTGPEAMKKHLMEADHRGSAMRYLGITSTAEYQAELARLDHAELRRLHSIAHEREAGRTVPALAHRDRPGVRPQTTTTRQGAIRQASYVPPRPEPTVTYQKAAARSGPIAQRGGLFGRRVMVVRQSCPAGGCP